MHLKNLFNKVFKKLSHYCKHLIASYIIFLFYWKFLIHTHPLVYLTNILIERKPDVYFQSILKLCSTCIVLLTVRTYLLAEILFYINSKVLFLLYFCKGCPFSGLEVTMCFLSRLQCLTLEEQSFLVMNF